MTLKKRKGSSMLMLLMIFALIAILGTAILALTAADYSMRVVASEKIQNLYSADSGIDIVKGIVKKEAEYAVETGNSSAANYLKNDANTDKSILKADGTTVDEDKLYNAANSRFKSAYKSYMLNFLNTRNADNNIAQGIYTDSSGKKDLFQGVTSKPSIDIPTGLSFDSNDKVDLSVTSTFETEVKRGQTSNKKTVNAHIEIAVPEYGDTYSITTKENEVPNNPVWQNAIAVDGNMKLAGQMEFDGNVFVRGVNTLTQDDILKNVAYNKYTGGISIGSDGSTTGANVNFNSGAEVTTPNSFNINGSNNSVNAGNIYAGNIYVGNSSKATAVTAKSNYLNCQEVYLSNDLSLNSEKTNINISKFYGVNDISAPRSSIDSVNYKSSSSIIVNSNDIGNGSTINIANKAIIMGTAYIDTKPEAYQTGEAVAIKGNYMTYGVHIPESLTSSDTSIQALINKYNENKVNFAYINPLMLVKSLKSNLGTELTAQQKIDYFKLCQQLNLSQDGTGLKNSGIYLPGGTDGVISFGLSPVNKNGKTYFDTNYDISDISLLEDKQKTLAEKIYEMNAPESSFGTPAEELYNLGNQNRLVIHGSRTKTIDPLTGYQNNTIAQVSFTDDTGKDKTYKIKNIDYGDSTVVYVNSEASDVILLGRGASYIGDEKADNVIDLKNMASGVSSGIIVVKGNIHVYGDIDFNGTIIAGGNFTTDDTNGVKKFRCNVSTVKNFIAASYDGIFKSIFINNTGTSTSGNNFSVDAGDASAGYVIDDSVVKLSRWKIEQ